MKKLPVVLFFIGFLYLYPLITQPFYATHDGLAHLVRFAEYQKALTDKQFPVRWASHINFSYGSPLFIFYYPFPYYLGTMIHVAGFSYETVFKIFIATCFLFSFWTFYLWALRIGTTFAAAIGAFVYMLTPYHFLNMYVRGDIGELLAFTLLPLVFYFLERNNVHRSFFQNSIPGGICYALVILSHNGVALLSFPVLIVYVLLVKHKFSNFLLLGLGFFLSFFFWFPALYEQKYLVQLQVFEEFYKQQFPSLLQLISPAWGFGADVAKPNGLSPQIGMIHILFFLLSSGILIKTKWKNKNQLFWFIVFFCFVFLATRFSLFFYAHAGVLRKLQFPWRCIGIAGFALSALTVYSTNAIAKYEVSKKIIFVLLIFLTIISFRFTVTRYQSARQDSYYQTATDMTFYHHEAVTKWSGDTAHAYPHTPVEIISGVGKISRYQRKSNIHTFQINAATDTKILDNTIYYPGWQVFIDGKKTIIEFQDPNHKGLLSFFLPKGKHHIVAKFVETPDRLFANVVSLVVFILCIVLFFLHRKIHHEKI